MAPFFSNYFFAPFLKMCTFLFFFFSRLWNSNFSPSPSSRRFLKGCSITPFAIRWAVQSSFVLASHHICIKMGNNSYSKSFDSSFLFSHSTHFHFFFLSLSLFSPFPLSFISLFSFFSFSKGIIYSKWFLSSRMLVKNFL